MQFSLREFLGLMTFVAVVCSLVRWIGPITVAPLYLVTGPASAALFLAMRKGCRWEVLSAFCAGTTAVCWAALWFLYSVATTSSEAGNVWLTSYVLVPVTVGLIGGHVGFLAGGLAAYIRTEKSRRPQLFQFSAGDLLAWTTAVAVVCGLIAWLGWGIVVILPLMACPAIAMKVVIRGRGKNPGFAFTSAAVFSGACYGIGSLLTVILVASNTSASAAVMPGAVLAPVLCAFIGGLAGVVISIPFVGLWYVLWNTPKGGPY